MSIQAAFLFLYKRSFFDFKYFSLYFIFLWIISKSCYFSKITRKNNFAKGNPLVKNLKLSTK